MEWETVRVTARSEWWKAHVLESDSGARWVARRGASTESVAVMGLVQSPRQSRGAVRLLGKCKFSTSGDSATTRFQRRIIVLFLSVPPVDFQAHVNQLC